MLVRIGIFGGGPQAWPSLNKTYAAYILALGTHHEVVTLEAATTDFDGIDAVVNFAGEAGWRLALRAQRPPIVFVLHGGAVLNLAQLRARLPTLQHGDRFIGNCQADRTVLDALAGDDRTTTHVVPLPVAAPGRTSNAKSDARAALGISADEGVIAIVSRLVPQKNVHNALRSVAAAMTMRAGRRWRVVIVGNFWPDYRVLRTPGVAYHDWLRAEVDRLAIEDLLMLFPGHLSTSKLATVYAAADIAMSLTHSIDENFGYFALEAMGAGVPVIGTAYGGQRDSIIAGTSGWPLATWYTPNGIRSTFGDAGRLLADMSQTTIDDMGLRAQAFVEKHYGELAFAERLGAICAEAIRDRGGSSRASNAAAVQRAIDPCDDGIAPPLFEHDALGDYAFALRRYVSDAVPRVSFDDLLIPFAPLTVVDREYIAVDPVWPVRYLATAEEAAMLDAATGDGHVRVTVDTHATAQHLVDMGMLVPARLSC